MKFLVTSFLVLLLWASGCAHPRIKRLESMLKPRLGVATRPEIDKLLGSPTHCKVIEPSTVCEYRTASGRNDPVPDAYRKERALGPDLSPYATFDVLEVKFDADGIFLEWNPVVIAP